MKKIFLICSIFVVGCISDNSIIPYSKNRMMAEMKEFTFLSTKNIEIQYRIYYPQTYRKIPVVFYLHGAGQRGNDNVSQLDNGSGSIMSLTNERDEFSSVVVAPQCPNEYFWRDSAMLETLREFITYIISDDRIDKNRVYVTGFSMGGDASWKLALCCSDIISTIVPICGGPLESMEPDRPEVSEDIVNLNIWAFNNFDDTIVRSNYSKYMFSKIWSYQIDDNLNFAESIDGSHDASNIYKNRKYMIWMLSTKRKTKK